MWQILVFDVSNAKGGGFAFSELNGGGLSLFEGKGGRFLFYIAVDSSVPKMEQKE